MQCRDERVCTLSVAASFSHDFLCRASINLPYTLSTRRKTLSYEAVLEGLEKKGISIRVASPKLVMEEAPESYKDVTEVVNTCHEANISRKTVKLKPIAVIKG